MVDGDDLNEIIQKAYDQLIYESKKKESVVAAQKSANKNVETYLVCKKEDDTFFHISKNKYDEKQLVDKIVGTFYKMN